MLFYRAALPLSSRAFTYVSGIIRRHRKAIGSLPGSEAPLLPLARWPARQGHPRPENSRGIRRMEKVHCYPPVLTTAANEMDRNEEHGR
jgi:hypothetical protein